MLICFRWKSLCFWDILSWYLFSDWMSRHITLFTNWNSAAQRCEAGNQLQSMSPAVLKIWLLLWLQKQARKKASIEKFCSFNKTWSDSSQYRHHGQKCYATYFCNIECTAAKLFYTAVNSLALQQKNLVTQLQTLAQTLQQPRPLHWPANIRLVVQCNAETF